VASESRRKQCRCAVSPVEGECDRQVWEQEEEASVDCDSVDNWRQLEREGWCLRSFFAVGRHDRVQAIDVPASMSAGLHAPLLGEKKEGPDEKDNVREERMQVLYAFRRELLPGSLSARRDAALEVRAVLDDAEKEGVTDEEAEVIVEIREYIDIALQREEYLERSAYLTLYYDFMSWMGWRAPGDGRDGTTSRGKTRPSSTA
jgi:hypothetical protein